MDDLASKTCFRCKISKPCTDFYKSKRNKDGLFSWCKVCTKEDSKEKFKRLTPEQLKDRADNSKKWRLDNIEQYKAYKKEYRANNIDTIKAKEKQYCIDYPARKMLSQAKFRAANKNIPFTITIDDILPFPDTCPVLGIPLRKGEYSDDPNSYSLDRIDNTKGYEPGNVAVISRRANVLKRDASLEEIELLCSWLREQRPPKD